jgi:hypothetical protein
MKRKLLPSSLLNVSTPAQNQIADAAAVCWRDRRTCRTVCRKRLLRVDLYDFGYWDQLVFW